MRENITQILARYRRAFGDFTTGQKAVAIVGGGALILAAFLVFRWVAAPSYAPLYSNLSASDSSAVIDQLNSDGVSYKLANNGTTIMVPSKDVYSTRISLAGDDLPSSSSDSGYGILDNASLASSDFQEQTNYKRAMEGELSNTLEAVNGVDLAIVHLAIPQKKVFTDEQDPTTASVLLKLQSGTSLSDKQVQAIVHLVATSVEGLSPTNVSVTDSDGNLLTTPDASDPTAATSQQTDAKTQFEQVLAKKVQNLLDAVVGVGNSQVEVNARLNYDEVTTHTQTYQQQDAYPAANESSSSVEYSGPAGGGAVGVVGPDGQMDSTAMLGAGEGDASYSASNSQQTNLVSQTIQEVKSAPGQVEQITAGVLVDSTALNGTSREELQGVVEQALGIVPARGDAVTVSAVPFNHDAADAAQAELQKAEEEAAQASRLRLYRDVALATVIALMILLAWIKARRRSKAREQATSYVVEQLRADAAARAAEIEATSPALDALEIAQVQEQEQRAQLKDEVSDFALDHPEDVAALLRGWLAAPR